MAGPSSFGGRVVGCILFSYGRAVAEIAVPTRRHFSAICGVFAHVLLRMWVDTIRFRLLWWGGGFQILFILFFPHSLRKPLVVDLGEDILVEGYWSWLYS